MPGESRIPRLLGDAAAARSLKLLPVDGYVLSRVDGKASERELAALTGLPDGQVRTSLEKLESMSVITFAPPPPPPAPLALPPNAGVPPTANRRSSPPPGPMRAPTRTARCADVP